VLSRAVACRVGPLVEDSDAEGYRVVNVERCQYVGNRVRGDLACDVKKVDPISPSYAAIVTNDNARSS